MSEVAHEGRRRLGGGQANTVMRGSAYDGLYKATISELLGVLGPPTIPKVDPYLLVSATESLVVGRRRHATLGLQTTGRTSSSSFRGSGELTCCRL